MWFTCQDEIIHIMPNMFYSFLTNDPFCCISQGWKEEWCREQTKGKIKASNRSCAARMFSSALLLIVIMWLRKCDGIKVEVPIVLLFRHEFKQLSLEGLVEALVLAIALRMIDTGDVALHPCHLTELIINLQYVKGVNVSSYKTLYCTVVIVIHHKVNMKLDCVTMCVTCPTALLS